MLPPPTMNNDKLGEQLQLKNVWEVASALHAGRTPIPYSKSSPADHLIRTILN